MIRFFERGYLKLLPAVAVLTMLSGLWMLWILSGGFNSGYMGSRVGMALSTGGALAIIGFAVGMIVMRPAAEHIWELSKQVPQAASDDARNAIMAEIGKTRARTVMGARIVFVLLVLAVAFMATAQYLA